MPLFIPSTTTNRHTFQHTCQFQIIFILRNSLIHLRLSYSVPFPFVFSLFPAFPPSSAIPDSAVPAVLPGFAVLYPRYIFWSLSYLPTGSVLCLLPCVQSHFCKRILSTTLFSSSALEPSLFHLHPAFYVWHSSPK